MSVRPPAAVDAFKPGRRTQTTAESRRRRSVGAADRWPAGIYVIKGSERESVSGQSGCDRGAAAPLWLDTSDRWLTAGRPCLPVRFGGRAQWERCWYYLLVVYIKSCLIRRLRGITALLWTPSLPLWPIHQVTNDDTNNDRQLCTQETENSQENVQ